MIDMNDRFPLFRSRLKGTVESPEEAYLPSLDEYTTPFEQSGFEIMKSEQFLLDSALRRSGADRHLPRADTRSERHGSEPGDAFTRRRQKTLQSTSSSH